MRTQGDDVAEILALIGVRPTWHPESRRVTGIEVIPLAGARAAAHRRHGAHLGLLPRRLPAPRRAARRRDREGRGARRARRSELRGRARARGRRAARSRARRAGLAPGDDARVRLEAGHLRRRAPAARGRARLARRRRHRPGLRGLGRLRLRPRPRGRARRRLDARLLRPHRGRGQERRLARARHPRLRRLLPVPRRHGRDRARAHGARAGRLPRRQLRSLARRRAQPRRGDAPRVPRARRQPALDRVDDPPRLQGRGRALRHRGLPLRLRRDDRRGRGLDVRAGRRSATCSTTTSPSS